MKRPHWFAVIVITVVLLTGICVTVRAEGTKNLHGQEDLSRLTYAELQTLAADLGTAWETYHIPSEAQKNSVLAATQASAEQYFQEKGNRITGWAWYESEYTYTKNWDFYTLKTHLDYKDSSDKSRKSQIYSEVYCQDGLYKVSYLKADEIVVVDNRSEYGDVLWFEQPKEQINSSTGIDLSTYTEKEIEALFDKINTEIENSHSVPKNVANIILNESKSVLEQYCLKNDIEIKSYAWYDREYTYKRDWDYYWMETHVDYTKGSDSSPKTDQLFSEVCFINGNYEIVFLKMGETVILDKRNGLVSTSEAGIPRYSWSDEGAADNGHGDFNGTADAVTPQVVYITPEPAAEVTPQIIYITPEPQTEITPEIIYITPEPQADITPEIVYVTPEPAEMQGIFSIALSDASDEQLLEAADANLLASHMNYPAATIIEFAEAYPEEVRAMYIDLFDEDKEIYERIAAFKAKAAEILPRMNWGQAQHYQYENAISIYLWLRYPDKYYIYKFGEVKKCSEELHSDYKFWKGSYASNMRNFYKFYDEIASCLQQDEEMKEILQNALTPLCYPDPQMRTLTADFGFYISHYIAGKDEGFLADDDFDGNDPMLLSDEWHPTLEEYTPGFTKEKWLELLNRKDIIGPVWGGTLAAFYGMGGAATCTQVGEKYNKSPFSISGYCTNLAKRIHKVTDCPILSRKNGQNNYWPILFQGKKAGSDIKGEFLWKIRPELYDALTDFDIMKLEWKTETPPQPEGDTQYWWLNANPKIWSFSSIAIGEVQFYTLYNENGNKRRIFQNFLDAKAGDLVIGYESNPVKQVVALAKITAAQDGEKLQFEKTEGLNNPIDYLTLKDCPELENMEYFQNPQGSLFKLTKDEYDYIVDLIRDENPLQSEEKTDTYTKDDFLEQVYMSEERYNDLKGILLNKKNVILQGAPGVGKTYAARRLAYSIMGEKDESRVEFVQFHQNYSYEDFVMGYKPSGDGFELRNGVFYRFCQKAANQPKKEYFFIIDEINRGNMSKIFGELLMLIEKDYRGTKATLAYNGLPFTVPENLYIIGMMNTADRSLAMIDYALRRRFSFFEMKPGFDTEGFIQYQKNLGSDTFDLLVQRVKELNVEIEQDKSLGRGFCIGHSYFCDRDVCTDEWLRSIVEYDILPTLSEYWFDEPDKLRRWENILRGVFQ